MSAALPPVAEKPRYVAAMFGRIAARYDLMNTLMTAGQDAAWRRVVAETALSTEPPAGGQPQAATVPLRSDRRDAVALPANSGHRDAAASYGQTKRRTAVLDVGTGTGKLAQVIVATQPAAHVVGVDFTYGMLRVAPPGLRLAAADALTLPFAASHFDAVVSAFVVRNLADVPQGLSEQVRVLRPNGKLVVLETTPGPPGPLRPVYRLLFRYVVPLLGRLIAGDSTAYTYLPESTLAFLEPARLAALLRQHGLVDVTVRRLALGCIAVTSGRKPVMLPTTTGGME